MLFLKKNAADDSQADATGDYSLLNCCEEEDNTNNNDPHEEEESSSWRDSSLNDSNQSSVWHSLPVSSSNSPHLTSTRPPPLYNVTFVDPANASKVSSTAFDENKWSTSRRSVGGAEPSLVEFFKKKSLKWNEYSKNLVDSHCHFDMLFSKFV